MSYSVQVTDHRVVTPNGNLYVRQWKVAGEAADAPVILLYHDSLGSVALWRDFPEQLAEATGLSVVAYDRLGFGQSDPNPQTLKPSFMMDEAQVSVTAIKEQLGIGKFIAFGHSVGGAMAVASAAHFPDDCVAVITESAQALVEDITIQGIRDAEQNFADPAQIVRLERYHGDKTRWVLDAWINTWTADIFADWTMDSMLTEVRCPLLAIHGDKDEFGSPAHPERIAGKSGGPSASMHMMQDTGHVPHRERPDAVLSLVNTFLRENGLIG